MYLSVQRSSTRATIVVGVGIVASVTQNGFANPLCPLVLPPIRVQVASRTKKLARHGLERDANGHRSVHSNSAAASALVLHFFAVQLLFFCCFIS